MYGRIEHCTTERGLAYDVKARQLHMDAFAPLHFLYLLALSSVAFLYHAPLGIIYHLTTFDFLTGPHSLGNFFFLCLRGCRAAS